MTDRDSELGGPKTEKESCPKDMTSVLIWFYLYRLNGKIFIFWCKKNKIKYNWEKKVQLIQQKNNMKLWEKSDERSCKNKTSIYLQSRSGVIIMSSFFLKFFLSKININNTGFKTPPCIIPISIYQRYSLQCSIVYTWVKLITHLSSIFITNSQNFFSKSYYNEIYQCTMWYP